MSVIFDAMLVTDYNEREAIEALNKALYERDTERHQQFREIAMEGAGGTKYFTTNVYAAAFNHLIPDDVEDCIRSAPWRALASTCSRSCSTVTASSEAHELSRGRNTGCRA